MITVAVVFLPAISLDIFDVKKKKGKRNIAYPGLLFSLSWLQTSIITSHFVVQANETSSSGHLSR